MLETLTSFTDPRFEVFSKYTDAELRDPNQLIGFARTLDATADPTRLNSGFFIAESVNVATRALRSGAVPFALLAEKRWEPQARELIELIQSKYPQVPLRVASHQDVEAFTGMQRMRGILVAFERPVLPTVEELLNASTHVAILENITNYTNIGALFRSAAALGVDAILTTPQCCDPLYRRAARVSMGTVFQVPWTRLDQTKSPDARKWPHQGLALLHKYGFETVALALTDDALDIQDTRLKKASKCAVVLGTEGDGLLPETIEQCTWCAKIPMDHSVDSLNVAAASAVAFWELFKRS